MASRKAVPILCLLALACSSLVCSASEKDPAVQRRKEFCRDLYKLLEQRTGYETYVRIAPGKKQDVLQLFPGAHNGKLDLLDGGADIPVNSVVQFKADVVDELLKEPYRSKLKEMGFTSIQIKVANRSASFPRGAWDIPLD